uniref:Uncharacterized protein n=1 Tax=Candidatus Kentrum sp. LFY TaxID=2126342 RepID=A0A450UAV1_9GAMM|nr:MAG: hypothetical protein BECKLFY1418B_GA0070995_10142 [Candidatus Kentron sp. LFY]
MSSPEKTMATRQEATATDARTIAQGAPATVPSAGTIANRPMALAKSGMAVASSEKTAAKSDGTMGNSGDPIATADGECAPEALIYPTKGEPLTAKEKSIHEQGLVSVLRQLHDEPGRAVFEAYGWGDLAKKLVGRLGATTPWSITLGPEKPDDQLDAEEGLLKRLVALNQQRAAEEQRGLTRWLRPEYQNPQGATTAQAEAALDIPATPQQLAKIFKNARIKRVAEILDTPVPRDRRGWKRENARFRKSRKISREASPGITNPMYLAGGSLRRSVARQLLAVIVPGVRVPESRGPGQFHRVDTGRRRAGIGRDGVPSTYPRQSGCLRTITGPDPMYGVPNVRHRGCDRAGARWIVTRKARQGVSTGFEWQQRR